MEAALLLVLGAVLLVFVTQAWKAREQDRKRAEWDSYMLRQHRYVERLLLHGVVPTYAECPHFFAQGMSNELVELARCLNAVATVKTAKARNNNLATAIRLMRVIGAKCPDELTAESRNVIAREVSEAALHNVVSGLRDEVGKQLAAAGRAKRPETKRKYINAAVAACDAVPIEGLNANHLAVVAALRESIGSGVHQ